MSLQNRQFARFAPEIEALPMRSPLTKDDLLKPFFLLHSERNLTIYYSPLEYINTAAKIAIVGITPGWTQMELAYRTARDCLVSGLPHDEVLRRVRETASFAGVMRTNLIDMLDRIDLPQELGISSSAELFGKRSDLLHTTSVVQYPTFVNGSNYSGSSPELRKVPILLQYVREVLAENFRQADQALIVPLGNAVEAACRILVDEGLLEKNRCLFGFPHPSGANVHRIPQFNEMQSALRKKIAAWF